MDTSTRRPSDERRTAYIQALKDALGRAGKDPILSDAYYRHYTIESPEGIKIEPADYCYRWYRTLHDSFWDTYYEVVNMRRDDIRNRVPTRLSVASQIMDQMDEGFADEIEMFAVSCPNLISARASTSFDFAAFHANMMTALGGEITGSLDLPDHPAQRIRRIGDIKRHIIFSNPRLHFFTNGNHYGLEIRDRDAHVLFHREEIIDNDRTIGGSVSDDS